MKSKLMILSMVILMSGAQYVFANEGHDHGDEEGSMMMDHKMGEEATKAVEIGNTICPVSGNRVDDGNMGEVVKYEYNGKIYNLCCKMCMKDFKKDPEKYSKIAEDEVKEVNEKMMGQMTRTLPKKRNPFSSLNCERKVAMLDFLQ